MKNAPIVLFALSLPIALFQPFTSLGDSLMGPGGGDLMNGGTAMLLLISALIWSLAIKRRNKKDFDL